MEKTDYKKQLNEKGMVVFVPRGNSMWPMLKNNHQSVIILPKTNPIKVYDVIFYVRKDGSYVLHRVLAEKNGQYAVCGDSQIELETVSNDQIIGVMKGFYKGKKFIEATDEKYLRKVEKWYKNKSRRKAVLKFFHFRVKVKKRLLRILKKSKRESK